jgi:hypothetical protein
METYWGENQYGRRRLRGYKLARKLCLVALADDVRRAEEFRGYWGDVPYTAGILEALELRRMP